MNAREKAKKIVYKYYEGEDEDAFQLINEIERAIIKARLEGAKMMQGKAAELALNHVAIGQKPAGIISHAIRSLNPSEVIK